MIGGLNIGSRKRHGLLFRDAEEFCEWVQLNLKGLARARAFELLHIQDPEVARRHPRLMLCGGKSIHDAPLNGDIAKVRVAVEDERVSWQEAGSKEAHEAQVLFRSESDALLDFVGLDNWRSEPEIDSIIVVPRSAEVFERVVQRSFHLGNDKIQVCGAERPGGKDLSLLKIDQPSYFVLQECLEDWVDDVEVYYPLTPRIYQRWGKRHPLEEVLRLAPASVDNLVLFRDGLERILVKAPRWRDIYDLADIELSFGCDEVWTEGKEEPARFSLPLRLEPSARQQEPELWLLRPRDLEQLERMLVMLDEEELRNYEIAFEETEGQETFVFLRERRMGSRERRHLEFQGDGFYPFQGMGNFFLPLGFGMLPPLRRDLYRQLFELAPGAATVILPGDGPERFRSVRIGERDFRPLSSLVDYIVQQDREVLEEALADSMFDLGIYARSPQLKGLRDSGKESRKSTALGDQHFTTESAETEEEAAGFEVEPFQRHDTEIDESTLSEAHKQELELERRIIDEGQRSDLWYELLRNKLNLGKQEESLQCVVEALWLLRAGEPSARTLWETGQALADQLIDESQARTLDKSCEPSEARAGMLLLLADRPDRNASTVQQNSWIAEFTQFLDQVGTRLRIKERWLGWGAVLELNRDERKETQLREEFRELITDKGLDAADAPGFIRTRVYYDRSLSEGGASNQEVAIHNLDLLVQVGRNLKAPRLRRVYFALLARTYSRLGAVLGDTSEAGFDYDDDVFAPWSAFFIGQSREDGFLSEEGAIDTWLERYPEATNDVTNSVKELFTLWQQRTNLENPAAFLAQENRARFYPKLLGDTREPVARMCNELRAAMKQGDEQAAVMLLTRMMTLEGVNKVPIVMLAEFVEVVTDGIERYRWGQSAGGLQSHFESFVKALPAKVDRKSGTKFYDSLLQTNIAYGLLAVDAVERAVKHLRMAMDRLAEVGEVDLLDGVSAILRAVEQLPLENRPDLLQAVAEAIAKRFDDPRSHFLVNARLHGILVKLLEQLNEVAVSRDRLNLERFKAYQLQDEFLVLKRIQQETFCQPVLG